MEFGRLNQNKHKFLNHFQGFRVTLKLPAIRPSIFASLYKFDIQLSLKVLRMTYSGSAPIILDKAGGTLSLSLRLNKLRQMLLEFSQIMVLSSNHLVGDDGGGMVGRS